MKMFLEPRRCLTGSLKISLPRMSDCHCSCLTLTLLTSTIASSVNMKVGLPDLLLLCLLFVVACRAVERIQPFQPVTPYADLQHNMAMTTILQDAINAANRHFRIEPGHLQPAWHWPFNDESYRGALFGLLQDPDSRYVQLGTDGEYSLFAAPWHVYVAAQQRFKNYVLFFKVHQTNGVVPVGFSDYRTHNLPGRSIGFGEALQQAATISHAELMGRLPLLGA